MFSLQAGHALLKPFKDTTKSLILRATAGVARFDLRPKHSSRRQVFSNHCTHTGHYRLCHTRVTKSNLTQRLAASLSTVARKITIQERSRCIKHIQVQTDRADALTVCIHMAGVRGPGFEYLHATRHCFVRSRTGLCDGTVLRLKASLFVAVHSHHLLRRVFSKRSTTDTKPRDPIHRFEVGPARQVTHIEDTIKTPDWCNCPRPSAGDKDLPSDVNEATALFCGSCCAGFSATLQVFTPE